MNLSPTLKKGLGVIQGLDISDERKGLLNQLAKICSQELKSSLPLNLNFICTHNSRRSQFAQIWSSFLAKELELPMQSFSGGTEVSELNTRVLNCLENQGFEIDQMEGTNPHHKIRFAEFELTCFSKLYNHESSGKDFIAIMVCDHADENCPFIPEAKKRFSLQFEDPKKYDDTELEEEKYLERSLQIAAELYYCYSIIRQQLD